MILERKRRKPRRQTKTLAPRVRAELSSRAKYPKGRIIRVSSLVFDLLQRKLRKDDSWDSLFRRLLNIPQRNGEHEKLYEAWILPSTREIFMTKATAKGVSLMNSFRQGGKPEEPIKVRQLA